MVLTQPDRKLSPAEIDELMAAYEAGTPIAHLSARFGMHLAEAGAVAWGGFS